jgi:cysteine-rich repeat protein
VDGAQCLTCEATTNHRTFNENFTCSCIDRFYDDGQGNQLCLACVYSCQTCANSPTTCTSCNATAFRTLSSGNCNCLQHFYDNLAELCLPCHYTCLTCTNPNRCTSCDASGARTTNTTTGLCSCMLMFWDDGSSQQCNKCNPTCLTCKDTLSCITCNITRSRMLNSTVDVYGTSSPFCVCFYRYFSLATNQDCQPCHYSCQVCTAGSRQSCVICNATALRYFSATTTACLCNDGTYDTNTTEQCQPCNLACTLCTTGLPNSCTACSPLYYLLAATTSCYASCPSFYFDYQQNFTCQPCSTSCQVCLNETYCSQCAAGSYLYNRSCLATCPIGTYTVTAGGLCNDCPTGCKTCTGTTFCSSCMNYYYYNKALGFCFSCNSVCLTCSGPGQNQCISCESPLHLANLTCSVLSCSAGTYVDPVAGCTSCSSLFKGSLNCNSTASFSCQQNYKLINSSCVFCSSVPGYRMANGICGEICGDGVLIYLQCDDGNNANGDGCSSNCLIEQGWNCTATGPSVCILKDKVTMNVVSYYKKAGVNELYIYLEISIPLVLSASKLSLSVTGLAATDYSYSFMQSADTLG